MSNFKAILWIIVAVIIGGSVFGMIKLAANKDNSGSSSNLTASAISTADYTKGDTNASVTLIEYSDFQCPACASYHPLVKKITEEYGDRIIFAYRHFPLPQHQNAKLAASAAEAAGKQGKFWEMHDVIFDGQSDWAQSKEAEKIFSGYAQTLNLNMDKFIADLNSDEVKSKIEADYKSGIKAGVNSTPSFFLNGKKINNPRNYDEFKAVIEQALAK